MNFFRKIVPLAATFAAIMLSLAYQAEGAAPGPKVSAAGNKHNLSASNTAVKYRAFDDSVGNPLGQQICIFCHTPHSANVSGQAPLWNRKFSTEIFQRYTGSTTLKIKNLAAAQYGSGAQPNGSSKLCLSCHDGVSNLGELYRGQVIALAANSNTGDQKVIQGRASFKPSTNKMRYGHHPVSFIYATGYSYVSSPTESQAGTVIGGLPVDYVFPQLIDGKVKVKLKDTYRNGNGWMQCTTCHDAHQNQSHDDQCYGGTGNCIDPDTRKKAPFWVSHSGINTASQDHDAVCTACHALTAPTPWPPL